MLLLEECVAARPVVLARAWDALERAGYRVLRIEGSLLVIDVDSALRRIQAALRG